MKSTRLTNKKENLTNTVSSSSLHNIEQKQAQIEPEIKDSQDPTSPVLAVADRPAFPVVAIGASAGGLEAITLLLQNLSPNTGMAFIYVQHLSPDHKSMLTALLSKATAMKVQEIEDMEKIEPDNVYVIPYNKEIKVLDGHIKLIPRSKSSSAISIDVLFSSLAETHKANVIGVVLSGSAHDGTRGLKEIKEAGGITFAQDDSAKFSSMPRSAITEGVVDFVLSPKEIAHELVLLSKHPWVKRTAIKPALEDEIENSDPDLKAILQLILKHKHVDFSHYKMNTIKRRMLRRMLIHKIKTIKLYAVFLADKDNEVDVLYQDLLINVTDFFRDTDAFQALKTTVLPQLLKNKTTDDPLRIWVAACATGEEVYSIAMMLFELQENAANNVPFQIFASDLSKEAIHKARSGEYSLHQLKNVPEKQIEQFFTKFKDKYRVNKALRDVCVFAEHNILGDPPFSRMDFISCRNLLIYLDISAQKKIIATFHYALTEGGFLMLGKSETIGTSGQLFSVFNKKYKIYTRKKNSGARKIPDITPRITYTTLLDKDNSTTMLKKQPPATNGNLGNAFDAALLTHYVPASVIINHDLEILQFRGSTSLYLQHTSGKASFNILKMAHPEISFELRNAIHHAMKSKLTVRKTGIEINHDKVNHTLQLVNIEVMPLKIDGEEPLLIVVFSGQQIETLDNSVKSGKGNIIARDRRIKKLEEELAAARSDMGSITHDQETTNEELQSANEEIVSSNEELQSLNEELETSKEEIESTNEELTTSNQELHARILQVEELHNYNEAILTSVHEPMLILDKHMQVKSVNKSFCKSFHVTEEECLGKSLYKLGNNQWNIPKLRELLEDIVPQNSFFQDFEVEHTFSFIGHKTMLLNAHQVGQPIQNEELIVLTISDITEVKHLAIELQLKETKALATQLEAEQKAKKTIEESNKRYNMLILQSPFAIAILKRHDMIVSLANDSIKEMWGKGHDIEDKPITEVLPEIVGTEFMKQLETVYTTGVAFVGNELGIDLKRNGKQSKAYFNFVYQPYREADNTISGVTIIAYEVTAQVLAKNELVEAKLQAEQKTQIAEDAVKAKQQFLSNMSHEIRTPMNAIIGFTHVVLKTDLDETQKEYINAIKISGDALIVLINDILDLAKVDAGKMTFEQTPFNLSSSISTMLQLFEPKIKEKNLDLIQDYDEAIPSVVVGDPMRLRQIILNLMSNAVKFTEKGNITMRVRLLKDESDKTTIEFLLTDTGIGIREDRLEHIFNNFEQAGKETSRSYGGTGLGLAIVKQLVERQGGSISIKSELGKGSTFGFVMSFNKPLAGTEHTNTQDSKTVQKDTYINMSNQKVKVLVVEDVTLNQLLIKIILMDFGFEIDVVSNGKIAVDYLQKNTYDIVLMDLQMPVMNGFEATAYIRNTLNSQIPIIALTADVTTVDVEKCIAVGMNDYISKPIDEKLLYSKIMKYLDGTA